MSLGLGRGLQAAMVSQNDLREAETLWVGHGLEPRPQLNEKDPQREERTHPEREKKERNLRRRREKSAKCWAPSLPGLHPPEPHPPRSPLSRPQLFLICAPFGLPPFWPPRPSRHPPSGPPPFLGLGPYFPHFLNVSHFLWYLFFFFCFYFLSFFHFFEFFTVSLF